MSLLRHMRARVYDAVITGMTATWYATVLARLPRGSLILDVGIGTGAALLAHRTTLLERNLHVIGIDIDAAYVERCRTQVAQYDLGAQVEVQLESVYDHRGGPYDAIYFSGSFMLLPDPAAALRHVGRCLRPGGVFYFTQTFEHQASPALEIIKPLLRWVTTIDFGRVTYEAQFLAALANAAVEVDEMIPIQAGKSRSAVLVVAWPGGERGRST